MDLAKQIEIYQTLCVPAADAIKPIGFGPLKGKSDINPQWRIEAMTNQFGLCGIGWKFEVVNTWTQACPDDQILLYMQVNVYIKEGEGWSAPIPGMGGDFLIKKDKNGLGARDEAYKGCLTDALGNALKCLGVAGNIYRGYSTSKYAMNDYREEQGGNQGNNNNGRGNNRNTQANNGNSQANNRNTQANNRNDQADNTIQGQGGRPTPQNMVRTYRGKTTVFINGKWYYLEGMDQEGLCYVVDNSNVYGACYEEAMRLLNSAGARK